MITQTDLELLNAYIDDQLDADQRAALDARLATDSELRAQLTSLRATVAAITALPMLTAPRPFTLTREQARRARALPFRQLAALASAAAAVLVVVGVLTARGGAPVSVNTNVFSGGTRAIAALPTGTVLLEVLEAVDTEVSADSAVAAAPVEAPTLAKSAAPPFTQLPAPTLAQDTASMFAAPSDDDANTEAMADSIMPAQNSAGLGEAQSESSAVMRQAAPSVIMGTGLPSPSSLPSAPRVRRDAVDMLLLRIVTIVIGALIALLSLRAA